MAERTQKRGLLFRVASRFGVVGFTRYSRVSLVFGTYTNISFYFLAYYIFSWICPCVYHNLSACLLNKLRKKLYVEKVPLAGNVALCGTLVKYFLYTKGLSVTSIRLNFSFVFLLYFEDVEQTFAAQNLASEPCLIFVQNSCVCKTASPRVSLDHVTCMIDSLFVLSSHVTFLGIYL